MVARGQKTRSKSPSMNFRVELDNRALKTKNTSLTQALAKLQKDNAELVKQLTLLQGESFEVNSKYNNLKNVISIIDSTTKACLPKLNEVVDTFTGIIQLCSVATNISNFAVITSSVNKDARTQAVKPQIVNGHVLHNPTITLSRLSNNSLSNTPPRPSRSFNDTARPSTSQSLSEENEDRNGYLHREQEQDSDSDEENIQQDNEDQNSSFICKATRLSRRKQTDADMALQEEFDSSDEENEEPVDEEEEEDDEAQSNGRLTTIDEMEEEHAAEQEMRNAVSPRSRQRRFLHGRLQEVRIYLNQLPNTYIEQFLGSGNISISVSPPERRSSFKHRSSSLVGDANESALENPQLYLDEVNCSRMAQGEASFSDNSRQNQSKSALSSTLNVRSPSYFEGTTNLSEQFPGNISSIRGLQTPSTSTVIHNEPSLTQSGTFQELDTLHIELQHKTSTPMVPRKTDSAMVSTSRTYDSPNRSKSDSFVFKSNITKRKPVGREKRKVAQVLLDRLCTEKRLSGSPIKKMGDIVNLPLMRKSSELRKSSDLRKSLQNDSASNSPGKKSVQGTNSDEENVEAQRKVEGKGKRRKRDSPIMKTGDSLAKPVTKVSPTKTATGRPKRAARPKTLKEPNLHKKMRRSK